MDDKPSNITGVFLDADLERTLRIELQLVSGRKIIYLEDKVLSDDTFTYGEFATMGDFHYGHECFSKSVVHGYLQYFKEHPNIDIGLMGDIIEYGEGRSFIRDDEQVPVDEQISRFIADFKPLKDRIRFILWGNHEEHFVRLSKSKRLMRDIVLELGLDPEDEKCYIGAPQRGVFVTFIAGENIYGAYCQHSKTNARINQELQLARAGSQNVVALIAHGHTHKLGFKPRTFRNLEIINGKIVNVVRRQFLCSTGCALKYPSYAEAGSYPYTEVGFPIIKFYADHNEIDYYDLTNRYKPYLERGKLFTPAEETELQIQLATINCPKCESSAFQRRGFAVNKEGKKVQRCQCSKCGKWFSYEIEE